MTGRTEFDGETLSPVIGIRIGTLSRHTPLAKILLRAAKHFFSAIRNL